MIEGIIEGGLHPLITLEVAGDVETEILSVLVDTGFDVDVALPFNSSDRLGLEIYDTALFEYANGECEEELLCRAQVNWHGQWKKVEVVLSNDEQPAIGTRLLNGCKMDMDFIANVLTINKPSR